MFFVFISENNRLVNWAANYSNTCLHGTSLHVSNLLIYSINNLIKKYCYSGQKIRDALISWGSCGNSVKSSTIQCWNQFIQHIDSVVSFPDEKLRVPMVCCLYHQEYQCNQIVYEDAGPSVCNEDQIEGLQDLFYTAAFSSLKYMCGIYSDNDNDKCRSILNLLIVHHDKLPVKTMDQLAKSPLSYAIKILDSIPHFEADKTAQVQADKTRKLKH